MDVPTGTGLVIWLVVAAVIYGLYRVVRATRQRSYEDYWDRRRAEEERRRDDPDMRSE